MSKMFTTALVAGILALATVSAQAQSNISIKWTGVNGPDKNDDAASVVLFANKQRISTPLGELHFVQKGAGDALIGKSFVAYCIELAQPTSGEYRSYKLGSFSSKQQEQSLQKLFSYASTLTDKQVLDTSFEKAAFQMAVWELTHERADRAGSVWGVNPGSVFVSSFKDDSGASTLDFVGLTHSYLAGASLYAGPDRFQLSRLSHSKNQDLVVATSIAVTPVPELGTYALMGAGLLAVGTLARRRKDRDEA